MSQDKQKLMQILNNLKKDYEEGLISEEKFIYLSNQYKHKIETIDVSNRIRAMQGRKGSDESSHYARDRNRARRSREEDENLVRKYIQNPESYTFSKPEKKEEKTSPWYSVLAIVFLLVAFGVGITFGISTFGIDGNIPDIIGGTATINDTAFPQVVKNKTVDSNITYTTTKTNYSSATIDSSDSDDSSSSSSRSSYYSSRSIETGDSSRVVGSYSGA
ncbi:MAG: hypothetical protein Q4Q19_00180, partial [Methanobrevibacter sp.]|nr:hypothetical protein [Methanobrevibacter sp.]